MSEDKTANVEVTTSDKEPKSKKKEKAIKNVIDMNPKLEEATQRVAVLGWGRMNPITVGHEKLANKIKDVAKKESATPVLFLTHSQDPKKNPLSYNDKVALAKKAFGNMVQKSNAKTIIQAMQELDSKFDKIVLVVGQDRVKEFETLLTKYNGKDYSFDEIKIVSAGDRDPDAEGVEGMSASKMRALVAAGKADEFMTGLPKKLKRDGQKVFDMVRSGMGIKEEFDTHEELEEAPLNLSQRLQRGRTMRKYASKIAAARKRAMKRKPTQEKLLKRAEKRARNIIRKKVMGGTDKSYDALGAAEKIMIDKKVEKRKAAIKRIAKKLLPQMRAEELDLDAKFEMFLEQKDERKKTVRQDSDIKDMSGTQPKKYYAGVDKDEKDDRARHFKKGAKMDDNNPAAYKPAPGDEDAETKQSKHTKKFKQMFGEATENDTKPKKRYHEARKKDGSIKLDRRFRAFRNAAKPITEDAEKRLKDQHKAELEDLKRDQEREMDVVQTRKLRKEIQKVNKEEVEIENDIELLKLVNEISESIQLEESKTEAALQKKADKSGISYSVLKKVYDRGVAAWRTGHRPGTTPAQWGMARVNSFATKSKGTWGGADKDLATKVRSEEVEIELDSFFDLNEQFELLEASILDKALAAIHKHVSGGVELGDIAYQVSRARGVDMSGRELEKAYIAKHGKPDTGRKSNPEARARLMKKFGVKEEGGAGDFGTDKLANKYKKDTPCEDVNEAFEALFEDKCDLVGMQQIKAFEQFVDRMFEKFGIDFNFTKHFGERMSDSRNDPCITMKELANFIKKIYANQGKSLKGEAGAEAVIKDIQSDLNIPVAVKYDAKNDEFDVVMKTIMRKKNFRTPNKVIKY